MIYYFLLAILLLIMFINYLKKRKRRRLFDLARSLHLTNHTVNAIKIYDRLIKQYPKNFIYYNNRGNCYLTLEDFKNARADFNKSIELEPDPLSNHLCYSNLERLETMMKSSGKKGN